MIRVRFCGIAALTFAAAAGGAAAMGAAGPRRIAVLAGVGAAYVLALPGYLSLSAVLHRSDKAFFSVFAGGTLVRLTSLVAAVLVWRRLGRWPLAPFALSAAGGLAVLSLLETAFLSWQNRLWTSYKRSNATSSTTSISA